MSWEDIPGWFGFANTYDKMSEEAQDGDTIVEIGVAFGRSVAYLAGRLIQMKKRVRVIAVDPWIDDRWEFPVDYPLDAPRPGWGGDKADWARSKGGPFSAFISCMREFAPAELEYIKVFRGRSEEAARFVGPCRGVLIDGNHDYAAVTQDIALWRPHIVQGGILAGDDWSEEFPGVQQAVREAFADNPRLPGEEPCTVDGTTWLTRRNAYGLRAL